MGLIRPYGNRGERPKGRRHAPPLLSELDKGAAPFSFFLSPSVPFSYSNKEGGSPTPGGSRTPPDAPLLAGRPLPPCSFIYKGRGNL